MPSVSSGRIVKARRAKNLTQHKKNHRWESFTTKISKLHSLDPLRKVRRHDLDAEDLSATTSYLRNGLEKWSELNISRSFGAFRHELQPLTESLAQILHFEDRIMDLLAEYISLQLPESLEPLLDLLTAFAHDLGTRFEKHYPRALGLIVAIASTNSPARQDVEVVEWTFAALAFLFKYLSRLLVPDLRPTYDAVAPLLGRSKVPGHIARFAAEAMSFLIKKAAAPSQREKALPLIVEHVRRDLEAAAGTRQFSLYSQGVMTMFAEALKSTGNTVHSTGPETFDALVREIPNEEALSDSQTMWTDVCCGVLTSIIHHSTVETFAAMQDAIVRRATSADDPAVVGFPMRSVVFSRILGTMAGVRKGSRVSDWSGVVRAVLKQQEVVGQCPDAERHLAVVWRHAIANTAVIWSLAPMDALIPSLSQIMRAFGREPLIWCYLPFCLYLADLDAGRFQGLFKKSFEKFLTTHWSDVNNEEMLCTVIPHLVSIGALRGPDEKDSCALPQSWQSQIVSKFERLEITPFPERRAQGEESKERRDKCLPKYAALLRVLESTSVHPSTNARIAELLLRKLKLALKPSSSPTTEEAEFILSHGFRAYLRMTRSSGTLDTSLSPLLRAAAPRFRHLPGYLSALISYEEAVRGKRSPEKQMTDGGKSPELEGDPLVMSLVQNLSTPSHELRLASLQLLSILEATPDQNSALAAMLQIEQTPLDLQNARTISVYIRKLGKTYAQLDQQSWLREAVPSFLFGMMTVKLSPAWDDAVEAMKQIVEDKAGETAVADLAFDWLDVPSKRWDGPGRHLVGSGRPPLTDFECLNMMRLHEAEQFTDSVFKAPADEVLRAFEEGQHVVAPQPEDARAKALKVLSALPAIAEKRSRKLVPYLLSFTSEDEDSSRDDANEEDGIQIVDEEPDTPRTRSEGGWSLQDRKALVSVFAQFNNPRVLYQSQLVYDALLKLLANGDIDLQKSALKAILTWKQEALKPYQESLEYLLDEARFKNELTVLFQGDNKIQPEHRPELMPVLLRLLYGRTISKKGAASGRNGLLATRRAVIRHLDVEDVGQFLEIALGVLRGVEVLDKGGIREALFARELLPARKQVGLLNMLESLINELGTNVSEYMSQLVNPVVYCLVWASRELHEKDGESRSDAEADEEETPSHSPLYRVAKTTALKCLCKLIQKAPTFAWERYEGIIISEAVSPRLDKLPAETTQGASWTLRLLSICSALAQPARMLVVDRRILPKVVDCLAMPKTKDEVKVLVLNIVRDLVKLAVAPQDESPYRELIRSELLDQNMDHIFRQIATLLRNQPEMGRELLETAIDAVVDLAPIVEKSENVKDMVEISTFLLKQPSRRVNPKVKGSILLILKEFIVRDEVQSSPTLKKDIYDTVAPLFAYFKDRNNRQSLVNVLLVFATRDAAIREVADLCADLNSYAERRLDEPDYNRRLSAFNAISKDRETPFTTDQWTVLLHNMVYFIRQDEEFGILSTNSADGICKFVEAARDAWDGPSHGTYAELLSTVVMPEIYLGARESSEMVRREHLRVMGALASQLREWQPVTDLASLVRESDDDSFFFHILSPAVSRQLQALHLLQEANKRSEFHSKNLGQFFIPLLEHFVFDRAESADDHGLAAQATTTIAALTASLEWQQYRALLRRFISYIESKPDFQKRVIRLLEKVVDSLREAIAEKSTVASAMDVDDQEQQQPAHRRRRLASTLPSEDKMSDELVGFALPTLLKYLHEKDETTVSARVPVGVIIVKIIKLLPPLILEQKLPGVLTDICHILRSKAWESREMARETLAKIACILGPESFGFVLKELRGALTKGYQLHVLSYTLHSILLAVIPQFKQGDLDYCLPSIVAVIMDDIFGITGQEKDAEDYVSQMKEVKSSKSQDSMELIAKNASIVHLADLVRPLQSLLLEKLDLRVVRKIEDLLNRITSGLLHNPAAESRDTLVFAYEVIQVVYDSQKPEAEPKIDPKLKRYLIQKGAKKTDRGTTSKHTYKLVRFAIDVVRAIVKKHESLRTAGNLFGFLPIIGDAVVAGEDEVKIAAFKLLTVVVKVPSQTEEFQGLYKVAMREAVKHISMSSSTATDLAQTSLKLISVVMRDRREIPVKDAAVDTLLGRLKDDLTEPLYRHVTFNFLRSVLDRRIETAVVYDTLDYVGTVMITNDDKDTRDLARGAFFQFLRDYPQKKSRWAKQLNFIIANLKYEREGGRLSVMEILHLLLMKSADDFVQEIAATCFIPLVFVVANDDSDKCRLAAGGLIRKIFSVADSQRLHKFLDLLRSWLQQEENEAVLKLGLDGFAFYLEGRPVEEADKSDLRLLVSRTASVLARPASGLETHWELVNSALHLAQIIAAGRPEFVFSPTQDAEDLWSLVRDHLGHQNATVRLSAIHLLDIYLAHFGPSIKQRSIPTLLTGSYGMELDKDGLYQWAKLTLRTLSASEVDEVLAKKAAEVLLFLGLCLESFTRDPESESDSDQDKTEGGDAEGQQGERRSGLGYFFWRLATIIRKETAPMGQALIAKTAAMDVLAGLCAQLSKEALLPNAQTILRPLRNLCDPSIPVPFSTDETFRAGYDALKTQAQAIMDGLQAKLGTAEYTKQLLAVSEGVRERRQQRSSKRKIEALTQPEKHGRDKRKKLERKKERRKVKGQQYRDHRRGY
ncbi:hypothetical protein VTK73DRAFT_1643 [Phialemonium thermophilum]|uniref:U3 small nucleolar RNA-associated protein 20 n=1 Tax=Phialemonium thermophilum TaxID=223376 RepID=A0ABR3X9I6_9PEZI